MVWKYVIMIADSATEQVNPATHLMFTNTLLCLNTEYCENWIPR